MSVTFFSGTLLQTDLHCPVTELITIATVLNSDFNNSKVFCAHNLYTRTFCVHFTLYMCASIHLLERLITEHRINVATTAHQKPVLY